MAQYKLADTIDPNKIFLINRSELEGRLEVQYYQPEINQLEKKIRKKSTKKLRDFILKISSGATPSVQEEEKFYSDEANGIPFLRVQNLNSNSRIDLLNLRYVNKETHENYLRRSQVSNGDLLVKITGVGRMAIASVAPVGFVGNTNQHMAVIKTSDVEVSNYLANYINLDVVERLASRRATGATRPALDYAALKSIPIIENIDFSVIDKAEEISSQKESEAKALLESIDSYLLGELGISLEPEDKTFYFQEPKAKYENHYQVKSDYELDINNKLVQEKRIFLTNLSEVTGNRVDPDYHKIYYKHFINQLDSVYPKKNLKEISTNIFQGVGRDLIDNSVYSLLKVKNIKKGNEIDFDDVEFISSVPKQKILINNDIISPFIGEAIRQIKFCIFKERERLFTVDNNTGVIRINEDNNNSEYVCEVLNSKIGEIQILKLIGGGGVPFLGSNSVKEIYIPIPPMDKQTEIANHIQDIRSRAKALQQEAAQVLEAAKQEVERMILGE